MGEKFATPAGTIGGGTSTLSNLSGSLATNATLTAGSTVKIMDTASLAVGVWLVNVTVTVTPGTASNTACEVDLQVDTATATMSGPNFAGTDSTAVTPSIESTLAFSTIVTVTVAGTMQIRGRQGGANNGTALQFGLGLTTSVATGYTAIKIG